MKALGKIYLDGNDLERDCEAPMRFRLTYDGPLLASQPSHITLNDAGERDRRAAHKHHIRRALHPQLKHFWETHSFLRMYKTTPRLFEHMLPEGAYKSVPIDQNTKVPLVTLLGHVYGHHDYKFVPLVREDISLVCSLRVLCLRRDHAGAVLPARDIDNRIKTLIDALSAPREKQGAPLGLDGKPLPPQDGEDPFYVLLDDDKQVNHLEVEADTLHAPPVAGEDESYVRLIIGVETRAVQVDMFNLSLS